MDTYGEENEEYKEARMNWGERKNELNKQIELNCGIGELRKHLDVFEKMKEGEAMEEIERKEKVENQLPTIQEENEIKWKGILGKLKKKMGIEIRTGISKKQIHIWK